jgi:flagellar biosynthetic protein FliO
MPNPILAFQNWYLNASPDKKKKSVLIGVGVIATLVLLLTTGSGDAAGYTESTPLFFAGIAVKLGAVLLLIVGGGVILRRWYGNRLHHGTDRQMHLVETVRLSPKQALHVVEVGGQHFLIGATDQSISMLSSVELQPAEPLISGQPLSVVNFGDLFSSSINRQTPPSQPGNLS